MSQRIRQLEDALSAAHENGDSKTRHPLLSEDLLALKFGSDLPQVKDEPGDDVPMSFGTLTLTDSGGSKYFGVSAGALAALLAEEELTSSPDPSPLNACVMQDLSSFLHTSRDTERSTEDKLHALRSCLPARSRALALCKLYLERYHFQPIERDELVDDILISVYNASIMALRPHKVAVLFMVFAVGALVDPNLPPCSSDAETYYMVGLRALDLRCISSSPDIETVIALSLVAAYHGDSSKSRSLDAAWSTMSLSIKLAQKIGLHREPSNWNLDPSHAERRRRLFWNLMIQDGFRSLVLGRPPTMSLSWIDCQIPDSSDSVADTLSTYRYQLTKDILWPMLDLLQSTSRTNYNAVLDLDRKIREMSLSPSIPSEDDCNSAALSVLWYLTTHVKYVFLLYIHRPFLALALLQHPENPMESQYAPSVLAAQTSASMLIRSMACELEKNPVAYTRFWHVWIYLFGAAVTAGSIVSRAPNMASSALSDLNLALDLFEKGADQSHHAKLVLPFIQQLKDKASGLYPTPSVRSQTHTMLSDEAKPDIGLYPGHAPVLSRTNLEKWSPRNGHYQDSRSSQSPPSTPPVIMYSQPGYRPQYTEHYSTSQHREIQNPSAGHDLRHSVRGSFDFSSPHSFSQSSPAVSNGLAISGGDLYGDTSLFSGESNHPHPSLNGHWMHFMQDSGIDYISS